MSKVYTVPCCFTDEDVRKNSFDQLEALADAMAESMRHCVLDLMRQIKRGQTYGKDPSC